MGLVTNWWIADVLILLGAALLAVYIYFKLKFRHWQKEGAPEVKAPSFPYGNFQGMSTKKAMTTILSELYNAAGDTKVFGAYLFCRPILVIRDLDLVKHVLVKDFGTFHDRGFESNSKVDPLTEHLFLMTGQEWRNLRIKLTPTFTSGKMKMMFSTLFDVGKKFEEVLDKHADDPEVEIKDILSRYTTDVISSVAFGLESESLKNPDCDFRVMSQKLVKPTYKSMIVGLIILAFPNIQKTFPLRLFPKDVSDFFINTVRDVMDHRVNNNVQRNDFFQLLLQLKTLGYIPDSDNTLKEEDLKNARKFTVEQAAAQAFLFFFAGFETTSFTVQFALYHLALDPEIQKDAQSEVDRITTRHGSVTYEALQEMELVDRIVSETLRLHPPAAFLTREASTDYQLPGTDIIIKKKTNVWIPVYSFQMDPKNFPNPEKFDPDRFLPQEKESRHPFSYLPFGDGPRSCIANRFALMQVKAGLVIVLSKFNVAPCKKTPIPLVFDPLTNLETPKGGMFLQLTRR